MRMKIATIHWFIKIIFLIAAITIAYLFALNGRYIKFDDDYFFDKWRCKLINIEEILE